MRTLVTGASGFIGGHLTCALAAAGDEVRVLVRPASDTRHLSDPHVEQVAGGADVLQITPRNGAPVYNPSPDADWGLHLVDANIALGNLVGLVRSQIAAYESRR